MNENDFVLDSIRVKMEENQEEKLVLNGINLTIRRGEWVSIVGMNGSGKSTLGRVIAGRCPVESGLIHQGWTEGQWCQTIMQQPEAQIVGETVAEDLYFGMENRGIEPDRMPARMKWAMAQVGLSVEPERLTSELSGGQKQLLAIAGSIAVGASMLIFDEATSMLDPASAEAVLKAAVSLHRQGVTILWITHHLAEMGCGDRVVALHEGEIVYDGCSGVFVYGERWNFQYEWDRRKRDSQNIPCERLGFEIPYYIQVARTWLDHGVPLGRLPLTMEQFEEALRSDDH